MSKAAKSCIRAIYAYMEGLAKDRTWLTIMHIIAFSSQFSISCMCCTPYAYQPSTILLIHKTHRIRDK